MCCQNFYSPGQFGSGTGTPSTPITCTGVACNSYGPSCFTPTSTNLCGYLQGIDNALCALQNPNLSCTNINWSGSYPCITGAAGPTNFSLCSIMLDINQTFCNLQKSIPVWPIPVHVNPIIDGNNGTFSGAGTLTGLVPSSNVTPTADNTIRHGASANSLRITTADSSMATVSTSTPISVAAGFRHIVRCFVQFTNGVSPTDSNVTISINGSGYQFVNNTPRQGDDLGGGAWLVASTEYVPDVNQNVTVTVQANGFTAGTYVNLSDLVVEVLTVTSIGPNYDYSLTQVRDSQLMYNSIANSFVYTGGNQTNTGLVASISKAIYNINGTILAIPATSVTLPANTNSYLFYDTWTNAYQVKLVALPDFTEIVLYSFVTNGSAVTSSTDMRVTTPFVGTAIAPATITGTQIASDTIADSNLTTTGVTGATYVGSVTVNPQGRITTATNLFTFTSPLSNAFLQYNTGSSQWVNTQAPIIDAGTTTIAVDATVNSPALTFRGYYATVLNTPIAVNATLQHVIASFAPTSALVAKIGTQQVFSVDQNGNNSYLNTLGAPGGPLTGGYYQYSNNITINAVTKSAPTFMDEFGNVIQLTNTNAYTLNYSTSTTTLNSYTSDPVSSAFTGIASGVGGTPYAQLTDLNTLRIAYETLRTSYDNLIQVLAQIVKDHKTTGFFG